MYRHVHVILLRTRKHSVYSHFLNTFTQKIIVGISSCAFCLLLCVLETSMWAEKNSPLHWTPTHARTHARTHAHTHEGGRRESRQTGREAGRQADREGGRQKRYVRGIQSLGLFKVYTSPPGRTVHSKSISTSLLLYRGYVIILFKAIFSTQLHTKKIVHINWYAFSVLQ